jgi:hypothetical protein
VPRPQCALQYRRTNRFIMNKVRDSAVPFIPPPSMLYSELDMAGRTISGSSPRFASHGPEIEADRKAILSQLETILASSLFRNSRRCHTLLRYVVTETVAGRGDRLKERTLGIEVFGRVPTYETNDDPIVRTSALEVRKRLAQYYHEPGRECETRIDLASGSYVPEFRLYEPGEPTPRLELAIENPHSIPSALEAVAVPKPSGQRISRRRSRAALVSALIIVSGLIVAAVLLLRPPDPIDAFWTPLWREGSTVTLATGTSVDQVMFGSRRPSSADGLNSLDTFRVDQLGFADAITMARVAGLVRVHGKKFECRRAELMTLDDLRKVPTVLIGAFNNVWTMRLNRELRFSVVRDTANDVTAIMDRQNPSKALWRWESLAPYATRVEDRAVVSRFLDPVTEHVVVLLAGLGRDGTTAAGEFVTESKYMRELARRAPAGWEHKNLQVVIGTEVVNGNVGPPRVIATHFW